MKRYLLAAALLGWTWDAKLGRFLPSDVPLATSGAKLVEFEDDSREIAEISADHRCLVLGTSGAMVQAADIVCARIAESYGR